MGVPGSIDVESAGWPSASSLVETLVAAGWSFPDGGIYVAITDLEEGPRDPSRMPDWAVASLEIDAAVGVGRKAWVDLYHAGRDVDICVVFHGSPSFWVFFDGSWPRLDERSRLTDYSCVLRTIVAPLIGADVHVLKVQCTDDFY